MAFETLAHELGHLLLYEKIGFMPITFIPRWIRECHANCVMKKLSNKFFFRIIDDAILSK